MAKKKVLLMGKSGAGKTSMVHVIYSRPDMLENVKPTKGFKSHEKVPWKDGSSVQFYDVEGSDKGIKSWYQYYTDIHAVVYVIDGSETNYNKTASLIEGVLKHDYMEQKPVLFVANKQDKEDVMKIDDIFQKLNINKPNNVYFANCSCYKVDSGRKDEEGEIIKEHDGSVEEAIEHLLESISENYEIINNKVLVDVEEMKKKQAREDHEKKVRLLKLRYAEAFADKLDAEIYDEVLKDRKFGNTQEDMLTEEEGLKFMKAEIGLEEDQQLVDDGKNAARHVAYYVPCMKLICQMNSPSKRRREYSWADILEIISTIRESLLLNENCHEGIIAK